MPPGNPSWIAVAIHPADWSEVSFRLKKAILAAVVAFGPGIGAQAETLLYDDGGVDNEFSTADNWDTNTSPGEGDFANIDGAFTVERSVDSTIDILQLVSGGATMDIPGGTHSDTRSGATTRNRVGSGSTGTVNQSGGSYNIGHALVIGDGGAGGNGTYNLTGGDLVVSRGSNSVIDGTLGRPSLDIGGGGATGLLEISGGSLTTRAGVVTGATGTFSVIGSSPSLIGIGTNGTSDGWWIQKAGGTLRVGVDSGGISPILVDFVDGSGSGGANAVFEGGAILDPYDAGGAAPNLWHTVMSWEGSLTDDGLVLSPSAISAGWEKRVVLNSLQARLNQPPPAADGAWIDITTPEVSWTDPAMWDAGTVAYGTDRLADFQNGGLNHEVSKRVDLPVDIVLGELWWRDSGGVNRDLIIESANSRSLIMDTTSGAPLIWAKNRSIYIDVPIEGDDGLRLRSQQSTQPGVVLRTRNRYSGLTTIIDDTGVITVRHPGDFGESDVLVQGTLDLEHSRALRPHTTLKIDSGGTVDLDFPDLSPGAGDLADLYVSALTLGGSVQPAGIYSASTHPAFFNGTGEVIVQFDREQFSMDVTKGAGESTDITWTSLFGKVYDLQESTGLAPGSWNPLATEPGTPPLNTVNVTMPAGSSAFYRIGERTDYLPTLRSGVVTRIDELVSVYLGDQNLTVGDIRHGQFHNSDNMRMSECIPVLVWAYMQPDSAHYQDPAVLNSAIWSMDHMVRAQGINGGYNEYHGWCGVPTRTNGKSSVVGFTTYAMGNTIRMMASLPEMAARLAENIDADGLPGNETQRLTAWNNMLSQVMPFQFSGNGRGHAPNQDLCALAGVYAVNEAYAALNGGALLKTPAEIAVLSNEIFHGQPGAASARPNGEWWSSTGMLAEGGHDFYGYDDNYGAHVSLVFLGYLAGRDAIAAAFLTNEYAEALQYFFLPDEAAPLGVYAEWGIARRAGSGPFDPRITPLALTRGLHPALDRLYDIALPHFAANPDANMQFSSPHHLQIGVWGYCEMLDNLAPPANTAFLLPAERDEAWVFQDDTLKILASKPAGGVPTYYTEIWDDPNQARLHVWGEAPETVTSQGIFP